MRARLDRGIGYVGVSIATELAELGHIGGPATMTMLRERWRSATGQVNVLAPVGGWDSDSREDLLSEFLSERLADLTDELVTIGGDEDALRKMTSVIMKNWLIDRARKTDMGAIRVRLETLLRENALFVRMSDSGQRWALAGVSDVGSFRDDEASLLAAARAVPGVRLVRWRDTSRRAPMASAADLARVMAAVLRCAGPGGVEVGLLTRVFQRRFSVVLVSQVPLDADDSLADRLAAVPEVSTGGDDAAVARAAEVCAQLSDRERRILLCFDDHTRVQEILQVGRSVAFNHIKRLKAALAALTGEDLDMEAVVDELVRLATADAEPDEDNGATSKSSMSTSQRGARQ